MTVQLASQPLGATDQKMDATSLSGIIDLLQCPVSGRPIRVIDRGLCDAARAYSYRVTDDGIPVFAEAFCSEDARRQQEHYDKVAVEYVENLGYPHTIEYMDYLNKNLLNVIANENLGDVAEICCGRGEAFELIGDRVERGIGLDISLNMLTEARKFHRKHDHLCFVQGDATRLPLASSVFDNVFMLGGIHHVNNRQALFAELARILKPGGRFYYREPVSDFFLWRWLRAIIYRIAPALDHETERPLLYRETVPVLEDNGLLSKHWKTHGFVGFCLFMNSDVLIFNRLFRFIPGIEKITRWSATSDEAILNLPGMKHAGLQVIGVAQKPELR